MHTQQNIQKLVVTGTDTGVGKTIICAALVRALNAHYWKPIQTGLDEETDAQTIARLTHCSNTNISPESYRLRLPASPHIAAKAQSVKIDPEKLYTPPDCKNHLIIEGAGGVLVPVNDDIVFADLFAHWGLPVIVVARTALGTINHSLLTIEALRLRSISIRGIIFVGQTAIESERTICERAGVEHLGRLPILNPLNASSLDRSVNTCLHLDKILA